MNNDLVFVCVLGKTVGFKGALKLHDHSDFNEQFKKGIKLYDKDRNAFVIKNFESKNNLVIFENHESIELAKNLVNLSLYATLEDTKKNCKLKKDEFFYFDIINLEVFEGKIKLGVIDEILENGLGYLFGINTSKELIERGFSKRFYIPYHDNFIKNISLDSEKIEVKNSFEILKNS